LFGYSSPQAIDQRFEGFEASAHFGVTLAKLTGGGALMDRVFKLGHGDA
jgi:uncharacterized protein YggE